jgi:hypothetical protein
MRTGRITSVGANRWRPIGLAVVLVAAVAGGVAAGHVASDVKGYTACVSKDGAIIKVKEGNAPSSPCSGGQAQVHFSGGDITSVTVGDGLIGGGINGAVSIGLDASFTLPQDCVAGEIVERTASGWACGDDDDTTYTAGVGLDLTNGAFRIEPDKVVVNGESCVTGKYVSGIGNDGHIECATLPAAGSVKGYHVSSTAIVRLAGTMPIVTLELPAGTFLLSAQVKYHNQDTDTGSSIDCWVGNSQVFSDSVGTSQTGVFTINSWVTFSGGSVSVMCNEHSADVDTFGATLTAIKVDTLN